MSEEFLRIDPETNLPRPIYMIAKSGTFICMRPTDTQKYDKLYFNRLYTPGEKMTDADAYRIKHVVLKGPKTVMTIWPQLVEKEGYKYM